jgi:hypothetical protein
MTSIRGSATTASLATPEEDEVLSATQAGDEENERHPLMHGHGVAAAEHPDAMVDGAIPRDFTDPIEWVFCDLRMAARRLRPTSVPGTSADRSKPAPQ